MSFQTQISASGRIVADDLRRLVHVPGQQLAGRHVLALAERALVDHAQLVVRHQEGGGVEQRRWPVLTSCAPVREDLRLAEAARQPVLVDDDRVVVADPQPLAFLDARVRQSA